MPCLCFVNGRGERDGLVANACNFGEPEGQWVPRTAGLRERAVKSYFFQLHLSPFLCESTKKGASPMKLFAKRVFGKKQLTTAHEAVGEAVPNRALVGLM